MGKGVDVQMCLGQQALEFAVLQLQLAQPFGLADIHAAVLGSPFVEAGIAEAVFAAQFFNWHAGFGLPQEANDLLFAVFAGSHVRHSPG